MGGDNAWVDTSSIHLAGPIDARCVVLDRFPDHCTGL